MKRFISILLILAVFQPICFSQQIIRQTDDISFLAESPIKSGSGFALIKKEDGTIWSWGKNDMGQLGINSNINALYPKQIALDNTKCFDVGTNHSLAVTNSGEVWTWGLHQYDPNGTKIIENNTPVKTEIIDAKQAAAGGSHSLVLLSSGQVMAWGSNISGQCGNGKTVNDTLSSPSAVLASTATTSGGTPLSNVKKVIAGSFHSLALKHDGTVWAWGKNDNGQITSTSTYRNYAQQVSGVSGFIIDMASGGSHNLALSSEKTVWAWGKNDNGQLGVGGITKKTTGTLITGLTNVVKIACGESHSLALKDDGTVWAWGSNQFGQLGYTTETAYSTVPKQVDSLSGIVAIGAGFNNSFAIKSDGTVWAWGSNDYGQITGSRDISSVAAPSQIKKDSRNELIWNTAVLKFLNKQTGYTGKSITVPIIADYIKGLSGFQFSVLYDPDLLSLNFAGVQNGLLLTDAGWNIVTTSDTPGKIFILGYNLIGKSVNVQGGELLSILFDLADDAVTTGNSVITNISFETTPPVVLSDSNAKKMSLTTQNCELTVLKARKGDINFDGEINVLDIQIISNCIVGTQTPSEEELYTGDMNNDSCLDVLDILAIISEINILVTEG